MEDHMEAAGKPHQVEESQERDRNYFYFVHVNACVSSKAVP